MSKISELSDGGVVQGGDTLIAVRSGGNVKVSYGGSTTANIDGGTIDDTVIGGTTAAAVTTTALVATTADINGGTIDDTVIGGTTAAAGTFTTGQFDTSVNVDGTVTLTSVAPELTLTSTRVSNAQGDLLGAINFYNSDLSGDSPNNAAIIEAVASTSVGASADLLFRTKFVGVDGNDATEAMRIDSSGNVGIGTSNLQTGLDVKTTNYTYSGTTYDIYGIIGLTSGGVRLGGDSTNSDSVIGTTGTGNMQFVTYNGSAWGSRIKLTNTGNVGIGTSNPAKALDVNGAIRASTGILFGSDTAAANTLDDYEEGTWTPDFTGSSSQVVTVSAEEGQYTKIGNTVFCQFIATVTTSYNEGFYLIWASGSLPFTPFKFRATTAFSNAEGFVEVTSTKVHISPNQTTDTVRAQFSFTV